MMPFVQEPVVERQARIIYFHTDMNPFGGHEQVTRMLEGKPDREVKIRFYGYADKVSGTAFPNFGEVNLIEPDQLPAEGTNYRLLDPAGARNWFLIWWRVAPGNPPRHYIYREWPDWETYGPWAEPSSKEEKADGEMGPAQAALGYGVAEYKALILRLERITEGHVGPDPYRRRLWEAPSHRGISNSAAPGRNARGEGDPSARAVREEILEGYVDSRAGRNQHAADRGGTCLIDKMLETQTLRDGTELGPMVWLPASGIHIDEGLQMVNDLLVWDDTKPFDAVLNSPALFVSRQCRNVIWALQHWTGRGGEKGACKDPVDLVRYGASGGLQYWAGGLRSRGGGSY